MAREKPSAKGHKSAPRPMSLAALRGQIDRLDREIVRLANQRARLAAEIGKLKDANGQPAYAPGREEDVILRAIEANTGPLSPDCIRALFRELISGSRALETKLRVAFLGPEYSYTHLAAQQRFGECVELIPVGTISAVFEEVNRGHAQFGLVPLENSTDGRIADTLDMFARLPARICGEVQLRIHHNLLARCARGEVSEVYSKPQALSQCRNWLAKHMPAVRTVEVASTTTAAQLAQEKTGAAAIASSQAARHYGLDVLVANIEDQPDNLTRFAVIGERSADRTGRDKTSLMFEIPHRPGSLADAMSVFKRYKLNLTWIESFPIARPEGGYLFFVECEGHEHDTRVTKALALLERKTLRFEVLGSYPRSTPIG
ncbi:MAG: prephenate dehydratase [Pirellulales bacterium]|nr:prephenate dehydratase [Pirellulales bacterium]